MIDCIAIVAAICLHGPVSIAFQDSGLSAQAVVRTPMAVIGIATRSDQIRDLDWRKMDGVCDGSFCVAYFKKCQPVARHFQCEYHFAQLGDSTERKLVITGRKKEDVLGVEPSIGILKQNGFDAEIRLSKLAAESSLDGPPTCRAGGVAANCWPKIDSAQ